MNYILVSSLDMSLESLSNINTDDLEFCSFKKKYLVEFHHRTKYQTRIIDCYSFYPEFETNIINNDDTVNIFHGYLLDSDLAKQVIENGGKDLLPQNCYYGVYSHAKITSECCYFASDEVGMSPIYYSNENGYIFISNNPHLIALYKLHLGIRIYVEKTLPAYHIFTASIDSGNTGYAGIYRVRPWEYISIDRYDRMTFLQKNRISIADDYESACNACIQELRGGMRTIQDRYSGVDVSLTGGFDTRAILCFMLDASLCDKATFWTAGTSVAPDVIVADMLAKEFNLTHRVYSRAMMNVSVDDLITRAKNAGIFTAMEVSFASDTNPQLSILSDKITLNGYGSAFTLYTDFVTNFMECMKKYFHGDYIDFNNLNDAQVANLHEGYEFAKTAKDFLTDEAKEIIKSNRKYILEFGYTHFPENMCYVDNQAAYRYRNTHGGLMASGHNCRFLYSPLTIETSRKQPYKLRHARKIWFDMMWRMNQKLCLIPLENRKYDSELYKNFSPDLQKKFSDLPAITGDKQHYVKMKTTYDFLLQTIQESLIDMLPKSVFEYVRRDMLESRLKEEIPEPSSVFLNLFAIAKWHETVDDLNKKYLSYNP